MCCILYLGSYPLRRIQLQVSKWLCWFVPENQSVLSRNSTEDFYYKYINSKGKVIVHIYNCNIRYLLTLSKGCGPANPNTRHNIEMYVQ